MTWFIFKRAWIVLAFLPACTPGLWFNVGPGDLARYDVIGSATDGGHILEIGTDIDLASRPQYLLSKSVDDIDCERATLFSELRLTPGDTNRRQLNFSRQGSPARALYEWHICFQIDGVTYRAWRGFDPGPGTELEIACFISQEQIDQKDTSKYLCHTQRVSQNFANHTEYSIYCWGEDSCKSFDTEDDYLKWASLNPLSREDLLQIAAAILEDQLSKDAYISGSPANYYLSVGGEDPPLELLERISTQSTRFYPASEFENQETFTMTLAISTFEQIEEGLAEGGYSTYCGPLCASAHTVIVEKLDGEWKIKSIVMDWVS